DVSGTDLGIWRRMRLVPFGVQIEESKIDRQLPIKLLVELPGILNWSIEGCLRWQKEGLVVLQTIRSATDEYQDEEDELGEFIEERCVLGPEEKIDRAGLHRAYLNWAQWRGKKMQLKTKTLKKQMGRGTASKKEKAVSQYGGASV